MYSPMRRNNRAQALLMFLFYFLSLFFLFVFFGCKKRDRQKRRKQRRRQTRRSWCTQFWFESYDNIEDGGGGRWPRHSLSQQEIGNRNIPTRILLFLFLCTSVLVGLCFTVVALFGLVCSFQKTRSKDPTENGTERMQQSLHMYLMSRYDPVRSRHFENVFWNLFFATIKPLEDSDQNTRKVIKS